MEIFSSRLFVNVVLLLCIFTYSIDGFSTRRKRLSRSSFKQIGNKGYRTFSVLDTLYNAYTYTTNLLNFRTDTTAIEGRQSSGVAGCKDCFMGLRVERREAIVVSAYIWRYNFILLTFIISGAHRITKVYSYIIFHVGVHYQNDGVGSFCHFGTFLL